ncbi:MAG: dynamin family protein [Propionicimonas sp.]
MPEQLLEAPTGPPVPAVAGLTELAELARRHQLSELEQRCATALWQAGQGEYNVAVLGQFKAGKSSLLNSLLGADLLPVQAVPATAVVTRVRSGERLLALLKRPEQEPVELPLAQLAEWVTQAGNPDNQRGVEWVEVRSPALADLAGLTLVDTPGTGSSWQANTAASLGWLPNAGAALVAVSATQPLAEADLRLIEQLLPHTPQLTVLLTRIDLLSEPDAAQVMAHVRRQLAVRLPNPPAVWPYSVADGYQALREQLREQLRELAQDRATALAVLTRHRIARIGQDAVGYLSLARAAAAGHDREVAALRQVLAEERDRLAAVRALALAQLQPLIRQFNARADRLLSRELPPLVHRIAAELETAMPGWHSSLAHETTAFRDWLAAALAAALTPLTDQTTAALHPLLEQGLEPIQQLGQAQRLQQRVRQALGVELQLPVPVPAMADPPEPRVHLNPVFDSHLELLSWAVPMAVLRPLVHRHFRRTLGWQVEKNLYRAGYLTAGRATVALQATLHAYLTVLADQVDSYQRLAAEPSDLPLLDRELAAVRRLLASVAEA